MLKLHYVRFGDLEASLVEMCNCMQCAEEHFVTWVVFWALSPSGSDDCKRVEREFK